MSIKWECNLLFNDKLAKFANYMLLNVNGQQRLVSETQFFPWGGGGSGTAPHPTVVTAFWTAYVRIIPVMLKAFILVCVIERWILKHNTCSFGLG